METVGPYTLVDPLGSGTLSDVWRGVRTEDAARCQFVAVKRPKPGVAAERAFVEQYLALARAAVAVRHPSVVAVLDAGEFTSSQAVGPQPCVVSEAVTGAPLNAVLNHLLTTTRDVPRVFALEVVRCVLEGLAAIHASTDPVLGTPLVHGDVCPANVLVGLDGRIRLADAMIGRARASLALPENQGLRYRWHYMSPEEARGGAVDVRSDIYAVGVMMHEMLSFRRMRKAGSPEEFQQLVASGAWTPLQMLNVPTDNGLDTLLFRALSPDPDRRYATADEFLADVSAQMTVYSMSLEAAQTATLMRAAFAPLAAAEDTARKMVFSIAPPSVVDPTRARPGRVSQTRAAVQPSSGLAKKVAVGVGGLALMAAVGGGAIMLLGQRSPKNTATTGRTAEPPRDLTHLVGGRTPAFWEARLAAIDDAIARARKEETDPQGTRVAALQARREDLVRKGRALGMKTLGGTE